jgi:UDP-N-acetylmuramate dehydrogenase
VHDRQALVLVNYGGAQASALLALAHEVRASVKAEFGVGLDIEPVVVSGVA